MKKILTLLCLFTAFPNLNAQDNNTWWEDFNQASNKESTFKAAKENAINNRERGFVAPNDGGLTLAFDRQIYRLSGTGASTITPYKLNGFKFGGTFHARIKGAIGMEIPILFRFGTMKDNTPDDVTIEYKRKISIGMQMGFMLCTSYRFRRQCYLTIAVGPKLDFTMFSFQHDYYYNGMIKKVNFIFGEGTTNYNGKTQIIDDDLLKQEKVFDLPISFGATFRYKAIGVSVHYDLGTINRQKDAYYQVAGYSSDYLSRRNDYLTVGLQLYLGKGLNK